MATYKNITIKKRGGGTRKQRVKVLKSGKFKFVKNLRSRVKKLTKRSKKKTRKRRNPNMARRKNRRGRRKFTLPLAVLAGLGTGLAMPIKMAMDGKIDEAIQEVAMNYTGWNGRQNRFEFGRLQFGLAPLIIGCLVHKFVGGPPLNVNRMLAAANVPVIRI